MRCDNCGAPNPGNCCRYCGTHTGPAYLTAPPLTPAQVGTIKSELLAKFSRGVSAGMILPNEVRRGRGAADGPDGGPICV